MKYYFLHVGDGPDMEGPYASNAARDRAVSRVSSSWEDALDDLFYIDISASGKANAYHVAIDLEWGEDGE